MANKGTNKERCIAGVYLEDSYFDIGLFYDPAQFIGLITIANDDGR